MTLTVDDVAEWLAVEPSTLDAGQCERAIAAVEAKLPRRYDVPTNWDTDPTYADFRLGVVMQVARLRRRGASPNGTIGFDVTGAQLFYDADVTNMLADFEKRTGRFA